MLEKRAYLILLFDFYGGLLTEKQRIMFDLYYQCDLSLGEIAEEHQVSRQAVFDIIRRTESTLEEYENKLHLVNKYQKNKEKLQKALAIVNKLKIKNDDKQIAELKVLIGAVINDT